MASGMDVNARLRADTAQFDSSLQKSGTVAERTAAQIEKASERARAAWQKELLAQERAAERMEQASRAKELAALKSDILTRSLSSEAVAIERVAAATERGSHSAVSGVQATSAAIRSLEGNAGLRAVENFLAKTLGLGPALQAIFPLIGAAAFAKVLFDIGEKIATVRSDAMKAGAETAKEFAALTGELRLSNAELTVTNDKLEDEIAKLEKRPSNGLQTGFDEATLAALRLAHALDADLSKVDELFKKNSVGFLGGLLSGATETGPLSTKLLADYDAVQKIRKEQEQVVQDAIAGGDKANVARAKVEQLVQEQKAYDALTKKLSGYATALQGLEDYRKDAKFGLAEKQTIGGIQFSSANDNSAILARVRGLQRIAEEEQGMIGGDYRHETDEQRKGVLEGNKSTGPKANPAAEQYRKMEQEAAALRYKLRFDHDAMEVAEYAFWERMVGPASRYPENLAKVQEKVVAAQQKWVAENNRIAAKAVADQKKAAEETKRAFADMASVADQWERAVHRDADALARLEEATGRNSDMMAEMVLAHNVATGAITRHDAAVQLAAYHADQYAERLKALRTEAAADSADSSLSPEQRQANADNRRVRQTQIEGERDRTAQQDAWAKFNETALGGATVALQEFIAAAKDSSKQIHGLVSGTLNSVNSALIADITGQRKKGEWTGVGRSVATDVAGTALKKAEGGLLGMLHLGDKGSRSNPMWVRSVGGVASGAAGAAGASKGVMSLIAGLIPGFANGVDNFAGGIAMVGENGPELVNLPSGASVTPNGKTPNIGNSGPTIHVDARGSTDPAQTMALVHEGIRQAAPYLMSGAVRAVDNRNGRVPASGRR